MDIGGGEVDPGGWVSNKAFEFFSSESEFMQKAAKTPRSNCVMDSRKAVAAGLPLSPIESALEQALKTWTVA